MKNTFLVHTISLHPKSYGWVPSKNYTILESDWSPFLPVHSRTSVALSGLLSVWMITPSLDMSLSPSLSTVTVVSVCSLSWSSNSSGGFPYCINGTKLTLYIYGRKIHIQQIYVIWKKNTHATDSDFSLNFSESKLADLCCSFKNKQRSSLCHFSSRKQIFVFVKLNRKDTWERPAAQKYATECRQSLHSAVFCGMEHPVKARKFYTWIKCDTSKLKDHMCKYFWYAPSYLYLAFQKRRFIGQLFFLRKIPPS